MTGAAAGGRLHAADPLLSHLAGREALLADDDVVTAPFGENHGRFDLLRVVIEKPAGSVTAFASLLVGGGGVDHVPVRPGTGPLQQQHDHQLGGDHVLHVQGAPTPDEAVHKRPREGRVRPAGRVGGDHVGVP